MKIIFIGTVEFSKQALIKTIHLGGNIVGVITKKESKFNTDFADLSSLCKEKDIDTHYATDVNSSVSLEWIKSKNPDIIFCFGWSSLIKEDLLNIPKKGIIGFHPAELPYNRGRHPIIWALVLGLSQTASTFFFMDKGADSGDLLSQEKLKITTKDTAQSLYDKITNLALSQIETFLPLLISGNYTPIKQEHSIANTWRKRTKKDGKIDFRMSSKLIYNLVRGLSTPYPGAHIELEKGDIIVWEANISDIPTPKNDEPGKIISIINKNEIVVKTGDGAIILTKHEFTTIPQIGTYI